MDSKQTITAGITGMDIRQIAGRIGAVVSGVSLNEDLSDAVIATLRSAWLDYKVLFFRDQQHLTLAAHETFARRFGKLMAHPTEPTVAGTESAIRLSSNGEAAANQWHTDESFECAPRMAGVLHAQTIPDVGGDTMWANTVAAYASLPDPLKSLADSLWAAHFDISLLAGADRDTADRSSLFEIEHPLVHVHPETGERALMLGAHAQRIIGLNRRDSNRLIDLFQDHITKPENIVRWNWHVGDVAMWDNRATQHYGIGDFAQRRVMHRVCLDGETLVGVDGRRSIRQPFFRIR